MATTDISEHIQDAAEGPAFASDEAGSMRQQPLSELIEADRYLSAKRASKSGSVGMRLVKLKPPGGTG